MFCLLWVGLGRFIQVWFKVSLVWTLTKKQTYAWAWALLFATQDICVASLYITIYNTWGLKRNKNEASFFPTWQGQLP